MKRWSLITAVLLLSSAWLVAQSGSAPQDKSQSSQPSSSAPQDNSQSSQPSSSAPQDNSQSNQPSSTSQQPDTSQKEPASAGHHAHTIQGCITSVAGGYTLTDNSGKTYQLAGDTSKLANENGHYDQVSGMEESAAGGAAASSGAPSTFTVRKIKVVSTTCPTK